VKYVGKPLKIDIIQIILNPYLLYICAEVVIEKYIMRLRKEVNDGSGGVLLDVWNHHVHSGNHSLRRHKVKKYCTVSCYGLTWHVSGEYIPRQPAQWYLPNGDMGNPEEPSMLDGAEVWLTQGRDKKSDDFYELLTEYAYNAIVDLALEVLDADEGSEYDIEADVPF
jgi:hypothetical protein